MPQLKVRDIKNELDMVKDQCLETNAQLGKKLDQVKSAIYVLAVIQLGLISHLLFSVLSK